MVTSAGNTNSNSSSPCSEVSVRKDLFIFRAEVKPTQKDKTYLKKDMYSSWIVLHTESADIKTAYCECPGG